MSNKTAEASFLNRSPPARWQAKPSRLRTVTFPESDAVLSPSIWSYLPVELVSEILVYMAFASRQDAYNLCLVSSSVRRIILPCLYHNVLLRSADQVPLFAAPFIPKRAFFGTPPSTKLLSHVPVHSLALAVPVRRPSIEQTLEKVAPAFTSVVNLAVTAQLLGAHAYWLRAHNIRPRTFMLYHLGAPHPVNFREPFFSAVTHIHTSTLFGFHGSSLHDLPQLTHVSLTTRANQPEHTIIAFKNDVISLLVACPRLQMLVFSIDNPHMRGPNMQLEIWNKHFGTLVAHNPRFYLLPYARRPRLEWRAITEGGADVFACAKEWHAIEIEPVIARARRLDDIRAQMWTEENLFREWKDDREWDLDLTQSPGYQYGRSGLEFTDNDTPAVMQTW
ncbi:hypothetical protein BV25DRAFT_355136 [Artomyces pyxidatus]|uniref:Uncharacterized protein n=1 Tax=Artomyces pyxidatus TaxID=48021 RepID=A0ACB8T4Q4_9AGAM|nr:hypothetical protein BV25DRAFT_355136 [Artomyces pyxidatus]